jgi:hypothetical protein
VSLGHPRESGLYRLTADDGSGRTDERMSRRLKRNAMLGIAVAAVAAGAIIVALTAHGDHHDGHGQSVASARTRGRSGHRSGHRRAPGDLAIASSYLGVSRAQLVAEQESGLTLAQIAGATRERSAAGLVDALVSAKAARLDASSTPQVPDAETKARLATLRRRVTAQVNRIRVASARVQAAAGYLGVGAARLARELRSGRSLAQIADSTPGKSARGVIDALVAARAADLQPAVAAGRLSRAQERAQLSAFRARITAEVYRARRAGDRGAGRSRAAA